MWAGGTVDMLAQGQTHGRERPVPGEARLRRVAAARAPSAAWRAAEARSGASAGVGGPRHTRCFPKGAGSRCPGHRALRGHRCLCVSLGETAPGGLRIRARDTEPCPHLVPPQDMEPCPVSLRSAHSPCWPEEGVMSGHCPDPGRQAAGGLQEGRSLRARLTWTGQTEGGAGPSM